MEQIEQEITLSDFEDSGFVSMLNSFYCDVKLAETREKGKWFSYQAIKKWYLDYKGRHNTNNKQP